MTICTGRRQPFFSIQKTRYSPGFSPVIKSGTAQAGEMLTRYLDDDESGVRNLTESLLRMRSATQQPTLAEGAERNVRALGLADGHPLFVRR